MFVAQIHVVFTFWLAVAPKGDTGQKSLQEVVD